MKTPRLLAVALLFSAVSAEADAPMDRERRLGEYAARLGMTFRETWSAAAAVDIGDGADEYDAYVLSAAYLYAHIATCSSITNLKDEPTRWVASTSVGEPPGDPGPLIFVEKATGATTSPENKTVTDPKSYLELVRR